MRPGPSVPDLHFRTITRHRGRLRAGAARRWPRVIVIHGGGTRRMKRFTSPQCLRAPASCRKVTPSQHRLDESDQAHSDVCSSSRRRRDWRNETSPGGSDTTQPGSAFKPGSRCRAEINQRPGHRMLGDKSQFSGVTSAMTRQTASRHASSCPPVVQGHDQGSYRPLITSRSTPIARSAASRTRSWDGRYE